MLDSKNSGQQGDLPSWNLLELTQCGCSIAIDITCEKIIHNAVAARFYGIEPWSSQSFSSSSPPQIKVYKDGELVLPGEMPIQRSAWYGDENNRLVLTFVWPDGVSKTIVLNSRPLRDETGVIIGAICIFEDITDFITMTKELNVQQMCCHQETVYEAKKLNQGFEKRAYIESEVAKHERFNIIRQLAAGIAHEVRNPMTTVRGFLQLIQNKMEFVEYKGLFDLMIAELDKANSVITDFLSLARDKRIQLKQQCLNELLLTLFPLLYAEACNQGKKLVYELGYISYVNIDANEIAQLVLNLTRNGLEAMSQDRCLRIKTFKDNQTIVLSVMDEGYGIISEHISKLGTLFFTTKEYGAGLGMPMCYDIAARHGAQIVVKTSSDGTTIIVIFPQAQGTEALVQNEK